MRCLLRVGRAPHREGLAANCEGRKMGVVHGKRWRAVPAPLTLYRKGLPCRRRRRPPLPALVHTPALDILPSAGILPLL